MVKKRDRITEKKGVSMAQVGEGMEPLANPFSEEKSLADLLNPRSPEPQNSFCPEMFLSQGIQDELCVL